MGILVVLFIVVPIVEIWLIIQVGGLIGVWPTIALLLADSMLGAMLLRQQGLGAWRRFNGALAERRFPGREVADGLLIAVGATLLLTPGFLTDAVGLLLLAPPTRAIARAPLQRLLRTPLRGHGRPGGRRLRGGERRQPGLRQRPPPAIGARTAPAPARTARPRL